MSPPLAPTVDGVYAAAPLSAFFLAIVTVGALFSRRRKSKAGFGDDVEAQKEKVPDVAEPPKRANRRRAQSMSSGWNPFGSKEDKDSGSKSENERELGESESVMGSLRRSLSLWRSESEANGASVPPPLPSSATSTIRKYRSKDRRNKGKARSMSLPPSPRSSSPSLSSSTQSDSSSKPPSLSSSSSSSSINASPTPQRIPRNIAIHGPPPRYTGGSSSWAPPAAPGTLCMCMFAHKPQEPDEMVLRRGEFVSIDKFYEDGWVLVHVEDVLKKKDGKSSGGAGGAKEKEGWSWSSVALRKSKKKKAAAGGGDGGTDGVDDDAPSSPTSPTTPTYLTTATTLNGAVAAPTTKPDEHKEPSTTQGMVPWHCLRIATDQDVTNHVQAILNASGANNARAAMHGFGGVGVLPVMTSSSLIHLK
ncbi:hypothetical protein HK104_004167 [Borealophlyctis nickersoniae]|nr:hypothetical protein HK104_004167 [Borealophlyctis nickersoniae]